MSMYFKRMFISMLFSITVSNGYNAPRLVQTVGFCCCCCVDDDALCSLNMIVVVDGVVVSHSTPEMGESEAY